MERLSSTTSVPPLVQVHLVSRRQHRRRHGGLGAPGTVTVGQSEAGAGHSAAAARVPKDARVPMNRVVEWRASRACTLCVPRAGLGCAHLTSQPHRGSTMVGPVSGPPRRARLPRSAARTLSFALSSVVSEGGPEIGPPQARRPPARRARPPMRPCGPPRASSTRRAPPCWQARTHGRRPRGTGRRPRRPARSASRRARAARGAATRPGSAPCAAPTRAAPRTGGARRRPSSPKPRPSGRRRRHGRRPRSWPRRARAQRRTPRSRAVAWGAARGPTRAPAPSIPESGRERRRRRGGTARRGGGPSRGEAGACEGRGERGEARARAARARARAEPLGARPGGPQLGGRGRRGQGGQRDARERAGLRGARPRERERQRGERDARARRAARERHLDGPLRRLTALAPLVDPPARREGLGGGLKPAAKNSDPDLSAGSAHLLPKCPVVCASCDARRAPRDGIGWAPGGGDPRMDCQLLFAVFFILSRRLLAARIHCASVEVSGRRA